MARSAIPDFGMEFPDYIYRPFPRYLGMDAEGNPLTANSAEEIDELKSLVVYPKKLGKDRHGNEVIAYDPSQEGWKSKEVAKLSVVAQQHSAENVLVTEPRRGPGRPPNKPVEGDAS